MVAVVPDVDAIDLFLDKLHPPHHRRPTIRTPIPVVIILVITMIGTDAILVRKIIVIVLKHPKMIPVIAIPRIEPIRKPNRRDAIVHRNRAGQLPFLACFAAVVIAVVERARLS